METQRKNAPNKNQIGQKRVPKTIKMQLKGRPKVTKVSNDCSNIKIWSARKVSFSREVLVRQSCKNGHGALVGLTRSERYKCGEPLFLFYKMKLKNILVFADFPHVKGTSLRKNVADYRFVDPPGAPLSMFVCWVII